MKVCQEFDKDALLISDMCGNEGPFEEKTFVTLYFHYGGGSRGVTGLTPRELYELYEV